MMGTKAYTTWASCWRLWKFDVLLTRTRGNIGLSVAVMWDGIMAGEKFVVYLDLLSLVTARISWRP